MKEYKLKFDIGQEVFAVDNQSGDEISIIKDKVSSYIINSDSVIVVFPAWECNMDDVFGTVEEAASKVIEMFKG